MRVRACACVCGGASCSAAWPEFPGLYLHLWSQRKKTLGKPPASPPVVTEGIQFPAGEDGTRRYEAGSGARP